MLYNEKKINIALIFAGGVGKRMNSRGKPKQFLELNGKPIIIHTIEKFEKHSMIQDIYVVCHKDWLEYLRELLKEFNIHKVRLIVEGGRTGQESIRKGLIAASKVYEDTSKVVVLVHDGVRPMIDEKTITDNIKCVWENGTSVTVSPVTETIIEEKNSIIESIREREACKVARAPQGFFLLDLIRAHESIDVTQHENIVDSASLM